jgi:hypothetical protein
MVLVITGLVWLVPLTPLFRIIQEQCRAQTVPIPKFNWLDTKGRRHLGLLGIYGRIEYSCLTESDCLFFRDVSSDRCVFIFRCATQYHIWNILQSFQEASGNNPTSYSMGIICFFSRKQNGRDMKLTTPSSVGVRNKGNSTSTCPWAFVTCTGGPQFFTIYELPSFIISRKLSIRTISYSHGSWDNWRHFSLCFGGHNWSEL